MVCEDQGHSFTRRGFTLTEVMVALFILVAGMVAATTFFAAMARAARFTDSAIAATTLAQAKVEELLEQTYTSMTNGNDTVSPYTRNWVVHRTNSVAFIDVTVGWNEIDNHYRTMALHTIRAP